MFGSTQREVNELVDFFVKGQELMVDSAVLDPALYAINGRLTGASASEPLKSFLLDVGKRRSKIGKPAYLKNPDLFFALLQYGVICDQSWETRPLDDKSAEPKDLLVQILKTLTLSDRSDALNGQLRNSVQSQFCDDDEELNQRAWQRISIQNQSLLGQNQPFLYTKINHGYWEFLLNSYVDVVNRDRYRDLSHSPHPASWRDTGFHVALLDALRTQPSKTHVGVSLSAGDRPFSESLGSKIDPIARGALNGLLGFLDALDSSHSYTLFEGSAPRDLLKDRQYGTFFQDELNAYEAILLMVPPTLRSLNFPLYKGSVHRLAIPAQIVHETYRVVLPTLLGCLEQLRQRHQNVCVITQSAVFAPLAAIAIEQVANTHAKLGAVSFFDLGRVLDVVRPDTLKNYASLAWVVRTGLDEKLSSYIKLEQNTPNFGVVCFDE